MGQKTPYPGVLMPEDEFRYLKTMEYENESLSKKITAERPTDFSGYVWAFLLGGAVGLAAASTFNGK